LWPTSGGGCLGRRTGANAKGTTRGRGVGAASRLDIAADPFCVADPLFEHTYLNFLNRTAPTDEYESSRSSNPLPLSKRLYRVFSIDFVGEVCQLMPLTCHE
jgi:hypothetical protein